MDESQVGWNAADTDLHYSAVSRVPVHILRKAWFMLFSNSVGSVKPPLA